MTRDILVTLLLCFFVSSVPRAASAEEGGAVAAARQHFLRGVELYQEGDFEAALADFERAYELAPHWGLLYNIGRVRVELHRYPAAVTALERYLEQGRSDVPAERRREVRRELRRVRSLVARIIIQVDQPSVASVYVDGTEAATTPLEEPLLVAAGRRTIAVRAEGFMPFRRDITIAGGTERRIRVRLEAAATTTGSIFVTTATSGVTISVDGEPVGTTPLDEPVGASPGRHVVEAERPGYEPVGRTVEVAAGELSTVEIRLRPLATLPTDLAGEIRLDVSEPDVEVFVDGEEHEGGPLPVGPHVVEVRRAGFHEWSREIDLEPEVPLEVEVAMLPTEAFLERYAARARNWQIAAWLTVGAGAAVLGTFIGLDQWVRQHHLLWQEERNLLEWELLLPRSDPRRRSTDDIAHDFESSDDDLATLRAYNVGFIAGMAVGGAMVAAGMLLAFLGPNPWRYAQVALAPGPGGVSLALGWTGL